MKIRVAWLAPYPVQRLQPLIQLSRQPKTYHPCSWIVNLSNALARRPEIELHLITESTLVPRTQTLHHNGITFHVIRQGIPLINRGFPPWFPLDLLTGFHRNAVALVRGVRGVNPDIVHGHGTEAAYSLACLRTGKPCLISIQGIITEYFKTNPDFRFRILRHFERSQVRRAKFFSCRTDFDTTFVRSLNPTARIFHIHEAMSPVFFQGEWKPSADPHILFVGSLQERKGIATLIRTLPLVKTIVPQARLTVIGDGSPQYVNQLHRLIAELKLTDSVIFLGQKNAEEIAAWHQQAQVFVLPSDNENSPNTLAEAMVSGMPIVASKAGGVPSMVADGETGLLATPRDPRDFAEKIIFLLQHPSERARLGANARMVARQRHWPDAVAEDTIIAYREILCAANPISHAKPTQ